MSNQSGRSTAIREVITQFLNERRDGKLEMLSGDDPKTISARAELLVQFQLTHWIADAARRVGQIQAVTHSLKPIHPDAKGSSLFCPPVDLPALPLVGSHCLGERYVGDVVGNAAALDVYKFLKLEYGGQNLLAWLRAGDADAVAALSDDPVQAAAWAESFVGLTQPRRGNTSSHSLAKQLYWQVGNDSGQLASFHLLAPLYATSLAHRVYERLQADRFSDAAKDARQARQDKQFHEQPVRSYPHLAVQKLGGTKPQNISQLNSERLGQNHLLASLPPRWTSRDVAPLLRTDSLLSRFNRRPAVRELLVALREFLETHPPKTMDTRDHRDDLSDELVHQFAQLAAEWRELPAGWTQDPQCQLPACERVWLEGGAAAWQAAWQDGADDEERARWPEPWPQDWKPELASRFAHWMNARLGKTGELKMGDPEHTHWRKELRDTLDDYEWELSHAQ